MRSETARAPTLVLALGLWLVSGCSGGYPLPPTRCDDYCDASSHQACFYYQPASCVASCEQAHLSAEACRAELDAVIHCLRTTPDATESSCNLLWAPGQEPPCLAENSSLTSCVALHAPVDTRF